MKEKLSTFNVYLCCMAILGLFAVFSFSWLAYERYGAKAEAHTTQSLVIPGSTDIIKVESVKNGAIWSYNIVIPKGYIKSNIQSIHSGSLRRQPGVHYFLEVIETRAPFTPRVPVVSHIVKLNKDPVPVEEINSVTFNVTHTY